MLAIASQQVYTSVGILRQIGWNIYWNMIYIKHTCVQQKLYFKYSVFNVILPKLQML